MLKRPPPGLDDLQEALAQPGCPVCRLAVQAVASYVQSLLYESVNDVPLRATLRRSRGLCHAHARLLVQPGSSLGAAIIQHDVLGELLRALEDTATARKGDDAAQALGPQTGCPVCRRRQETEALYLGALLKSLPDAAFYDALQASDGLCLPHVQMALRLGRDDAHRRRLVAAQRVCWERLRAELAEFIRKNDYRFRGEGFGPEADAWQRAVAMLVGDESL